MVPVACVFSSTLPRFRAAELARNFADIRVRFFLVSAEKGSQFYTAVDCFMFSYGRVFRFDHAQTTLCIDRDALEASVTRESVKESQSLVTGA